ncbi:MAG: PaaI family thioesterase [Rhodococcus sp. (in: high G+C Gram-positive bacteria)]|uniref:PaaI family thioesterase n=1 Tax=Rhodococcus sp. TaxID=1831 RepID=UPI003BB519DC
MPGLDFLRGLIDGSIPHHPTSRTLGFTVTDARDGFAEVTLEAQEFHANAVGSVHGGVLATLFDTAMGFAVSSTLAGGTGYTTLDVQVRYLRPVQPGHIVRVQGFCEHSGRRTATARGEARDEQGRLLATGSTTCMILS